MSTRPRLLHLLLIGLGLALLAAGAMYYTNASDPVDGLPVPSAPSVPKTPDTPEACAKAGGVWNECASACPPDAQVCTMNCVQKCEGLGEGEKIVDVYFPNSKLDPKHLDCTKVFPVKRAAGLAASGPDSDVEEVLQRLLAGPTETEKAAGYFTTLPEGVSVNRESNADGTLRLDFSKEMGSVAGSCRVQAIRSQIEATFKNAFPKITNVLVTVDGGKPDEALQP